MFSIVFRNENDSCAICLHIFTHFYSANFIVWEFSCPVVKWRSISRTFLLDSFYVAVLHHYTVSIYHKGLLVITLNLYSDESTEKEKYISRSLAIMLHKIIRQFRKLLMVNCPSYTKIILILMYRVKYKNDCGKSHYFSFNYSSTFEFALRKCISLWSWVFQSREHLFVLALWQSSFTRLAVNCKIVRTRQNN